jgi:hypothetical protein
VLPIDHIPLFQGSHGSRPLVIDLHFRVANGAGHFLRVLIDILNAGAASDRDKPVLAGRQPPLTLTTAHYVLAAGYAIDTGSVAGVL